MCCFMAFAFWSSPLVNFCTYSSTCSVVNPRSSTVLSKLNLLINEAAFGLVVVKTVAPPRMSPDAIFLKRKWIGMLSLSLYRWLSSLILVLPEYSSNPSKITSTLFGFRRMYFQTSSVRSSLEYSEWLRSSRRLSFSSCLELNLLSLMRKATLKSTSDFCASLHKLSDAQSRRIFVLNIVFPIPGRPKTSIFCFSAPKISPGGGGCEFSLGCLLGYTSSRSSLSPAIKSCTFTLPSWIKKSMYISSSVWSLWQPSPGLGLKGSLSHLSVFLRTDSFICLMKGGTDICSFLRVLLADGLSLLVGAAEACSCRCAGSVE